MPQSLAFVSFADRKFRGSLHRIRAEARTLELFDHVWAFDDTDLSVQFWAQHREFVLSNDRLFGYGIWKPYVVAQAMEAMPADGTLVYCDAGCSLNREGVPRMREYIALAREHGTGMLGFHGGLPEAHWTKMDVLQRMGFNGPESGTPQIWSGMFILVKGPAADSLLRSWYEIVQDYSMISDAPSFASNAAGFREHRHDQSVFSILFKKAGGLVLDDETWWPGEWVERRAFPIHARRWKHFRMADREELERAGFLWSSSEKIFRHALSTRVAKLALYGR